MQRSQAIPPEPSRQDSLGMIDGSGFSFTLGNILESARLRLSHLSDKIFDGVKHESWEPNGIPERFPVSDHYLTLFNLRSFKEIFSSIGKSWVWFTMITASDTYGRTDLSPSGPRRTWHS